MIVLTDLSEVLIHGFIGTEEIVGELYGEDIKQRFWRRHLDTNNDFCDLVRGKMTEDVYWRIFLEGGIDRTPWPFGINKVKAMFGENMTRTIPKTLDVYNRIIAYPRSFEGDGFGMAEGQPTFYLVSDHITERLPEIHKHHPEVFKLMQREFLSCEIGSIKQDAGFFDKLLDAAHLRPGEVVFIDDSPTNVCAAICAGIKGIIFENPIQLEDDLKKLGFRFSD